MSVYWDRTNLIRGVKWESMEKINVVNGGKLWQFKGDSFTAKVYVPDNNLPGNIVNFGFKAPFTVVFQEKETDDDTLVSFAIESGLAKKAAQIDASVVFVYPACEGGWENASAELYKELIASSKIGQFYKDGELNDIDRFGRRPVKDFIRGAIFRCFLYGSGASADYIAKNLLKTVEGQYLWGPGEITPAGVFLEKLSFVPSIERRDIPLVSAGNSEEINAVLKSSCDCFLAQDKADYVEAYDMLSIYKRWCGTLEQEPDFETLKVVEEYSVVNVTTSEDNCGTYKGTENHPLGYFAWYNKNLFEKGNVPVVLAFHGGGDSANHIAYVSGWWEIAHKYDFLLIAVENHLDVTATEVIELIDILKKKYPIDEKRIYATGFSMGGCKTWDLYQEYPEVFAAMAPMDATFDVGHNIYDNPAPRLNRETPVPVFYAGGEITPLPELPFQAQKCYDRIKYLLEVNEATKSYNISYQEKETWENPIWGINGDREDKIPDESRGSILTIQYFECREGIEKIALAGISGQGHECRLHTCTHAWVYMSQFSL